MKSLLKNAPYLYFSKTNTILNSISKKQYVNNAELYTYQSYLFKNIVIYAYKTNPYYSRVINNETLTEIKNDGTSIIANLPFLNKNIIRNEADKLYEIRNNHKYKKFVTSGGSTGEAVKIPIDKNYLQHSRAIKILFDQWAGYNIGQKKMIFWGALDDLERGRKSLRNRLTQFLKNEYVVNAYRITPDQMTEFVDAINTIKPRMIFGYPATLYEIAKYIINKNRKVYNPHSIMTSAATLYPEQREMIESVFNAKVFNRYGSREVGDIACECDHHRGLHISPFTHFVEIIRDDGTYAPPGEIGEIVVTSLTNYAMPVIRYRIGDMGAWAEEDCTCGRKWPLLKEVTGRVTDLFKTRDGSHIYGNYFTRLFYDLEWVKKFQVVQKDYEKILVRIIPVDQSIDPYREKEDDIEILTRKIKKIMHNKCDVLFEFCHEITVPRSGKHRYTISEIDD